MSSAQDFYRHFSFESFSQFLSQTTLENIRQKMKPNSRERCLGLAGFIWLGLLVAANTSLPSIQGIFDLAGQLPGSINSVSLVSVSAFCQYRAAFSVKVMLYLWHSLLGHFQNRFKPEDYAWHGLKLRALDATSLNLPEKLYPYFGASGGLGPGPVQGFLMVLYDLTWQVPLAFRMRPADDEGRPHLVLKHLMHHLKMGELLLVDAGLYSLEIFCLLLKQNIHFIIPMPARAKPKLIKRFSAFDGLYQITASSYWKDNSLVLKQLMVRIITYQKNGFRTRRLLTSLIDEQLYPADEIVQIYHRRWDIETFFREFKHTLQVTHWHAKTLPAIYSELLFQMLLVTLTRLVMSDAATCAGILPRQISFGRTVAKVKQVLSVIVAIPVSAWQKVYKELIEQIKKYQIDVRPERSYERDIGKRRKRSRSLTLLLVYWFRLMEKKYA